MRKIKKKQKSLHLRTKKREPKRIKEGKILILGDTGVGKSAITVQFVSGIFVEKYDPTIEDSYRKQLEVDGKNILLEVLDTALNSYYTAMRDIYIKNSDAYVFVYSIVNQRSFDNIKESIDTVIESNLKLDPNAGLTKHNGSVKLKNKSFIIVGNKKDLEEDSITGRVVTMEDGKRLADSYNAGFFETSAKNNLNINNLFQEIVRRIWKAEEKLIDYEAF